MVRARQGCVATNPRPMKSHRQPVIARNASGEQGQALIWLLGTIATCAAVFYAVFSVGQLHAAKAKTVNAADAAALAGATVEARMLNLIAYNNRSMIANEVLLVQLISIESWLGYFRSTANNFGSVVDIVGTVFWVVRPIGKLLDETAEAAEKARDGLKNSIDLAMKGLEVSKDGAAAAHKSLRLLGGLAAEDAATKVVVASRAEFGVHKDGGVEIDNSPPVRLLTFALNEKRWLSFTKRYGGNARVDARQVLLESRDEFSTNRPGQKWFNFNGGISGTVKQGGTRLQGFDRWEAQDTLETWVRAFAGKKTYAPIGWGRANVDESGTQGSRWSPNRAAQSLAWNDGRNFSHEKWSGVPAVFDIADKALASRDTLGIDFVVAVRRRKENTMTSSTLGLGGATSAPTGSSEMPERLQGDQLGALAKARVSFIRPQNDSKDRTGVMLSRRDAAKEHGSLFSPYWQARLVDLTLKEKGALVSAMGVNPLNSLVTPGGQK
jgi:Putative Flp pilus-assembly TadE/G-like